MMLSKKEMAAMEAGSAQGEMAMCGFLSPRNTVLVCVAFWVLLGCPLAPCWCLLWYQKVPPWIAWCCWAAFCRGTDRRHCHRMEGREAQGFAAAGNGLGHLLAPWCETRVGAPHMSLLDSLSFGRETKLSFLFSSSPPPRLLRLCLLVVLGCGPLQGLVQGVWEMKRKPKKLTTLLLLKSRGP